MVLSLRIAGRAAAVIAVAAGLFGVAVLGGAFETSVVEPGVETPMTKDEIVALTPKGRYLVSAADCYACHTAKDGPALAGGVAFPTPVGTIYATNITPDVETGIGGWSRAEFHRAVRDGIGRHGRHLYPAMPYDAYRLMTAENVDAIYAYLMSREPIRQANKENELPFPFSVRRLMTAWNLINLGNDGFKPDPAQTEIWNRGRYVVDALGHCGTCHTPRSITLGSDDGRYLAGGTIDGMEAPDITPAGLAALGFDPDDLKTFMRSGIALQGTMTNKMFDVVHFSTQYLDDGDLSAMATFLMGETPPTPRPTEPVAMSPLVAELGRDVYLESCAGCHGRRGEGIPHVSVPMRTNTSLRLASAHNLLHTVLNGIPEQRFPGLERMQPMPGFADRLSDDEAAALASWMRASWGGRPGDVEPSDVLQVRR